MTPKTDGTPRILLADPDPARRADIVSRSPAVSVLEAASMSEAFDVAEAHRPDAIALSADITGDPGLDMFLHLVDALSISLVVYGLQSQDRTPERLRKSIPFVDFGNGDDPKRVLDGLLMPRADPGSEIPRHGWMSAAKPRNAEVPSLIVLGASTGGVSALETVLTSFPATCPPTLVVQHIRAGFVEGMIKRLDGRCLPRVLPAEDAVLPRQGHVYIAHDPDRHLVLQKGEPMRCRLKDGPARHGHRPSVDALFESVAERRGVAAALLTGMGSDGADGLARIRQGGGFTIAQNEATCVVYGMPKVAVERGAAEHVLPLQRIADALIRGSVSGFTAGPLAGAAAR